MSLALLIKSIFYVKWDLTYQVDSEGWTYVTQWFLEAIDLQRTPGLDGRDPLRWRLFNQINPILQRPRPLIEFGNSTLTAILTRFAVHFWVLKTVGKAWYRGSSGAQGQQAKSMQIRDCGLLFEYSNLFFSLRRPFWPSSEYKIKMEIGDSTEKWKAVTEWFNWQAQLKLSKTVWYACATDQPSWAESTVSWD